MRTVEYRFHFALALASVLFHGQSVACEPPAGFVNPPRPEVAPFEELLTHTEERDIALPLSVVMQNANRPLRIDATKDLAGVSGTFRLSNGPYGTVRTQPAPDKTRVNWTYRFALKSGLSREEKSRFQKVFLEQQFALWMRTQMDRPPSN